MFVQTWFLPFALLVVAIAIAIPLSRYMAWIMDGKYRPLPVFRWFEQRLDSGPQNWKQYLVSLLVFNAVLFVFGFHGPGAPAVDAPEPGPQGHAGPEHHIPQRHFLHDEHGPPALLGRPAPVELQPDILRHLQSLPVGRDRPVCA